MIKHEIWIVDDDESIRWVLQKALAASERRIRCFSDGAQALSMLTQAVPDVVVTDLRMPGTDGLELLDKLNRLVPDLPVILMTAYSDLDTTVAAYARGAHEYLPKPFDVDEVCRVVARALERRRAASDADAKVVGGLWGDSAPMQQVFRQIGRLSRSHLNVLIVGETGTGKELAARALHQHSLRMEQPFVALNTAAVPTELLESELFGHERGAFTGAQQRHLGRFEQAHRGTLFLDEVGDMPLSLQTRLLRVLAEGEFYRVGGRSLISVDVRIIAATHRDLAAQVASGAFREDLYHRLNVVQIAMPPLRERGADICLLARSFLDRAATEMELAGRSFDGAAERLLSTYSWPGNVRELENLCRRLTVMAPGTTVSPTDFESQLGGDTANPAPLWETAFRRWFEGQLDLAIEQPMAKAIDRLRALMLGAAVTRTGGRLGAASRLLGCGRNTLSRNLRKLNLDDK